MKRLRSIFTIVALLANADAGFAQGFANLNFESADTSGHSPGDMNAPIANAFPGWTGIFTSSLNTNTPSLVGYDEISLGGPVISIDDSSSGINSIQGVYSALLFGGGSNPLYSSALSQTGMVPVGAESLLLDANFSGASFVVTLGGQNISMTPLQSFSNFTLYGGNVSSFAGQTVDLSIIEPPSTGTQPSSLLLDNIQFSPSSVPEPGALSLTALGGSLLIWRRWKQLNLKL